MPRLAPGALTRACMPVVIAAIAGCGAPIAGRASAAGYRGADGGMIVPFRIDVPDAVLSDVKQRLTRTRIPDEIEGAGWKYGVNRSYLSELVAYWRDQYDWRAHERRLNQFEQFTTEIDGVTIHFVHRRARNGRGFPVIMTHGYPSSFVEFIKVIEPLTDPAAHGGRPDDAFDVVIPSMPGYGFSGKPTQPGYSSERMAVMFAKLMARLGYDRYGAQGGDRGAQMSAALAAMDPQHVSGLHLNLCIAPQPAPDPLAGLTGDDLEKMKRRLAWYEQEAGYGRIQESKPQTLGVGLNDSPAGLAAWIVEKWKTWSGDGGDDIDRRFTKDELLTNVMIYWVTETATSAARVYYESTHSPSEYTKYRGLGPMRVEVPTACLSITGDRMMHGWYPRSWVERKYNLVRWNVMPEGGHFAAAEAPAALVADMRGFFAGIRRNAAQ